MDSNPFARSILQIKGFLNTRGRVTTESYNKFKTAQGCSCVFKNVRMRSIVVILLLSFVVDPAG